MKFKFYIKAVLILENWEWKQQLCIQVDKHKFNKIYIQKWVISLKKPISVD